LPARIQRLTAFRQQFFDLSAVNYILFRALKAM